jgi:hypothetical protein
MSERPTHVTIGPVRYPITWTWRSKSHYGESNYACSMIRVDTKTQSEQQLRDTLIHECMHMMLKCSGPDVGEIIKMIVTQYAEDSHAVEEFICQMLAPRWFDFLADNPDALAWIVDSQAAIADG